MSETVLQHALRQRNEAMDEISHACEVLSAYLNSPSTWEGVRSLDTSLIALRDRLRDFYYRDWPGDERAGWQSWQETQDELGVKPPEDARLENG